MDRNSLDAKAEATQWVALRKESVDRNSIAPANSMVSTVSLSARRAWIEILSDTSEVEAATVALRKESVDRNGSAGTYPPG